MKKILFLLLLTVASYGQVSTGQEQEFDYGIKNNATQTITNPDYLTTTGLDGTQGKILGNAYTKSDRTININGVTQDLSANRDFQTGYADTGVLTFDGLSPNSSTTINIGACKGWIIDNETNPLVPTKTYVDYAGATNVTVPGVGSAIGSYVLLNSSGLTFITTQPTPAQRKAYLYLGKVGHPSGTITVVANTPDNILSPLGQVRALYNAIDFINEGVSVAPNGANLNVNLTAGFITGSGINFVTDNTTPNRLTVNPQTPATFIYRTQTGAGGGATTTITPGVYDVGGVVTAVPGGSNTATVQYIFYAPGAGVFFQLGQTTYPSLSDAVANADKETFTIYPNFVDNVIPIGQLVVIKSATDLSNTSQARFLKADKFGELGGASAGISTATQQSAYNNSLIPQIVTSTALGAMTYRRGSASDTDNIIAGQNGAGTNTFGVTGNGAVTGLTWNGYTPENTANKSDSYTASSSTTYASTKALVDGLATKAPTSGSSSYIHNQSVIDQPADIWIGGKGKFSGSAEISPTADHAPGGLPTLKISEAGENPNYGLGLSFYNNGGVWMGKLQSFDNAVPSKILINPEGGGVNIASLSGSGSAAVTTDATGNLIRGVDLATKADLASPALTGTPTAPTATAGTNTTQIATTAFVMANAGSGGSYTPTSSSPVNITSVNLVSPHTYQKVGDIVTVRGYVNVSVTTANTATSLVLTLPFSHSNNTLLLGSGSIADGTGGFEPLIVSSINSTNFNIQFKPTQTGSTGIAYMFQYNVND